jgi:hypothetical protein
VEIENVRFQNAGGKQTKKGCHKMVSNPSKDRVMQEGDDSPSYLTARFLNGAMQLMANLLKYF